MNTKDKELLLKDLCARLPYGVQAKVDGHYNPLRILGIARLNKSTWAWKKGTYVVSFWNDTKCIDQVKPYLRPMSSMTKEEDKEWQYYKNKIAESCDELLEERIADCHNFFNSHHLDYRGLIEKGLALEARKGMYKTE